MDFVGDEEVAAGGLENIWTATADGDFARIQTLIAEGVSVNAQDETGYTPMHAASSYGQHDLIRYLLSIGGDINIVDNDGDSPLLFCEDPETFELLLSCGANAAHRNYRGEGVFEKAIDDDNEALIRYFADKGFISQEQAEEAIARIENGENEDPIELDVDALVAAAKESECE